MAYPVSAAFKEALVAPRRDVTMRVTALQQNDHYYKAVLSTDGLVAYWRLGESDASDPVEDAYSGYTGAYYGSPTFGTAPGIQDDPLGNSAITLDGSADYAAIPTATALHPGDVFSLELWYRRTGGLGTDQVIYKNGGSGDFYLYLNDSNKLVLAKFGSSDIWTSDDSYDDSNWHHLVLTKNGNDVHGYVDGLEIPGTTTNATIVASVGTITIGAGNGLYFEGSLDEVALYNLALTAATVSFHYSCGVTPSRTRLEDITATVAEGIVYVDVDRATRRTAQIRVINKDGRYTPTSPDYSTAGTNALFWWDKLFSLEYGLKVGEGFEYVPLGIFMIDRTDILAERGASVIEIDGSDLWKKFTYSTFARPKAYFKNTTYNQIIADFANAVGIGTLNLDPLDSRLDKDKQIQVPLYFEIDDNRGDKLRELCDQWGLEIFFDISGYLTTRDVSNLDRELLSATPVWNFTEGDDAILLSVTKSKSGDKIFNHIVVTGENDDGEALVVAESIDGLGISAFGKKYTNNVSSPTRVEKIGDRVRHITSKILRTTSAAQIVADRELALAAAVEEDLQLPVIVIPFLEGNDPIGAYEPRFTKTNDKYRARQFDIPMNTTSKQELHTHKVRVVNSTNLFLTPSSASAEEWFPYFQPSWNEWGQVAGIQNWRGFNTTEQWRIRSIEQDVDPYIPDLTDFDGLGSAWGKVTLPPGTYQFEWRHEPSLSYNGNIALYARMCVDSASPYYVSGDDEEWLFQIGRTATGVGDTLLGTNGYGMGTATFDKTTTVYLVTWPDDDIADITDQTASITLNIKPSLTVQGNDFTMFARITAGSPWTGASSPVREGSMQIGVGDDSDTYPQYMRLTTFAGNSYITTNAGDQVNTSITGVLSALSSGSDYYIQWEFRPSRNISRSRIWLQAGSRPDWQSSMFVEGNIDNNLDVLHATLKGWDDWHIKWIDFIADVDQIVDDGGSHYDDFTRTTSTPSIGGGWTHIGTIHGTVQSETDGSSWRFQSITGQVIGPNTWPPESEYTATGGPWDQTP